MPVGWALKVQSFTRYLFNLAMARLNKYLAKSHTFKAHYELLGFLEVPLNKSNNKARFKKCLEN